MLVVAENKLVRRGMFSTKAFFHVTLFLQTPDHTKKGCCLGRKQSKTNVAYLIDAAKIFAQREFFFHLDFLHVKLTLRNPILSKNAVAMLQIVKKHIFPPSMGLQKKFGLHELFSSEPLCALHNFYTVAITQKLLLSQHEQSKKHILHIATLHENAKKLATPT